MRVLADDKLPLVGSRDALFKYLRPHPISGTGDARHFYWVGRV